MYTERVSLRDVLAIIRSARYESTMSIKDERMMDYKEYVQAMDRELQLKLGNAIAKSMEPSWATFSRDRDRLPQRSIETWVLTREQVDAIVMVLMKLAEKMKTFEIQIPIYGELDVAGEIPKSR